MLVMDSTDDPYPRPIATVDLAIFALADTGLEVLLVQRVAEPFAGAWALPGGFIHVDEDQDVEAAAKRVLSDKTGVETPYLEQLQTVGDATRDPRGWSLSIAYFALISADASGLRPGANALDAAWRPVDEAISLPLAFDHVETLKRARKRLEDKVEYTTLPVHLLPMRFTLGELQSVYERILGRPLDKSAFRKRMAEADFVEAIPGEMRRGSNRPAKIYRTREGYETVFFDRNLRDPHRWSSSERKPSDRS
jgi:ADP-ribose pyrophosphatase YjhB (NUDIX family)